MKRHFAWIGTDGVAWDFNETANDAIPPDPWEDQKDENKYIMRPGGDGNLGRLTAR
jgi:hypothetical protein